MVNEDNNKQSSVEWLYEKMFVNHGRITIEEFEQAKSMHKEEIESTYDDAIMKGRHEDGYEYYEQTFGDNK